MKMVGKMAGRKVVLYARCNYKDESALDKQMNTLREYAEKYNYDIVAEYSDYGCDFPAKRPGMQEVMQAAAEGVFETLIVINLDRLSRKQNEMAPLVKFFTEAGVKVQCVDGYESGPYITTELYEKLQEVLLAKRK